MLFYNDVHNVLLLSDYYCYMMFFFSLSFILWTSGRRACATIVTANGHPFNNKE